MTPLGNLRPRGGRVQYGSGESEVVIGLSKQRLDLVGVARLTAAGDQVLRHDDIGCRIAQDCFWIPPFRSTTARSKRERK